MALFETQTPLGRVACTVIDEVQAPRLQAFFEANPEYFRTVYGRIAKPTEAHEQLHDLPPPEMPYADRWVLAFDDERGRMVAMGGVLADFLAEGVWHIGLFIVASDLHGTGIGRAVHDALASWMRARGARWIRLGVVVGNVKAERFWERMGYREVRRRLRVAFDDGPRDLRVMVKPLDGASLEGYLERVARDRPEG